MLGPVRWRDDSVINVDSMIGASYLQVDFKTLGFLPGYSRQFGEINPISGDTFVVSVLAYTLYISACEYLQLPANTATHCWLACPAA